MDLSEEQYLEVETLSGAGWNFYQLSLYFGMPNQWFYDEYSKAESQLRYHYDRGLILKQAERDLTLSESAKAGSASAVSDIEKLLQKRKMELFKEKLLGGY